MFEIRTEQISVAKIGPGQGGTAQVGAGEHRAFQDHARKIAAGQIGAAQIRPLAARHAGREPGVVKQNLSEPRGVHLLGLPTLSNPGEPTR